MPSTTSIVIITRNTKDLLKGLMESLEQDLSLKSLIREMVVVDNASLDGTDEMVRSIYPHVLYIKNNKNMGFARSANMGFAKTTGDYILFLNSDTIVIPGELKKMIDFMDREKSTGICGPQLVYHDMRLQRSFAYLPNILFEIIPRSFLEFLLPKRFMGKKKVYKEPIDVESLIGAAFMVRRGVFESLGGFDERFFFFLEETDLCVRARSLGSSVKFFPQARIIHLQGRTVSKAWVNGRIEYNISLYKFIKKHHSGFYFCIFMSMRFTKALFTVVFLTVFPILLLDKHIKRSYMYYRRLLIWHLKGCQEKDGLRD
ncbi:MAG TPA: glycosyltransferase family 2 protein [Syntrophorhabdaceae bacterium]|nr:glycosyltransferase family 2 protein [Syntrophorhabdaceae bacterium]